MQRAQRSDASDLSRSLFSPQPWEIVNYEARAAQGQTARTCRNRSAADAALTPEIPQEIDHQPALLRAELFRQLRFVLSRQSLDALERLLSLAR